MAHTQAEIFDIAVTGTTFSLSKVDKDKKGVAAAGVCVLVWVCVICARACLRCVRVLDY
jgi:hypothetical protein